MVGTVGSSGSVGTGRQHFASESVQGIFQKRPRTISTNSSIHQPSAGMAKVQSLPDFDNISIPSITLSNSGKTDITPIVQDALGVAMEQMGSPASLCSVKVLKSPKQKKKSMELRMTFNPKNDLDMQSEMSHQEMKEVEDFMEDLEESEYQTRSHWSSSQMQPKRTKSQVEREWERRSKFWDSFATTYSLIYGIFLIMAGVVAYTFDLFGPSSKAKFYHVGTIGESFNVYLSVVGIIIICVLMLDIHKYLNSMRSYQNDQNGKFKLIEGEDGELIISVPLVEEHLELPDYYLFTTGRHSGSFFLRIGAAIFCVGHIIHMLVIMVRQIQYFFLPADQVGDLQCTSPVHILSCLLKSIYDFLQLYMIFKYSNVIVNRSKRLARFCFMHCLAASLCLWIHAIMHETVEYVLDGYVSTNHTSGMNDTCTDFDNSCLADRGNFELDIDCLIQKTCVCTSQDQTFGDMFTISAYSFPFTIEFGILTAGVWYVMWSKIGKVAEHHKEASYMPSLEASDEHNKPIHDSLHIFADCSKAIKGIFFGILFFVTGVIGLIVHEVFYLYPAQYSPIVNDLFEGILLLSMVSATIYVYWQVSRLDVNPNPISFLDDLLLIICLPAFFVYSGLTIIASIDNWEQDDKGELKGSLFTHSWVLIQVLIQTPMIIDGLRRCSDSTYNQERKPGRSTLTFLIIANLVMYLWESVEIKNSIYMKGRKNYYGEDFFTIAGHMCLPLTIFYRFHSSVAMVDIWSSAYRPGSHH